MKTRAPAKTKTNLNPKSEARNPKEAENRNLKGRRMALETESRTRTRTSTNEGGARYRHGKIARLPVGIREGLNRALAQGISGPKLLEWLNGLPETGALLRREFRGQPVSQQNLSQWRQGGFRDWLLKQEAREVFQEFASGNQDLAGLELGEKLALWLGSRYVALARCLERQGPEESWPVLRQLGRDVAALRRGDHRVREIRCKEQARRQVTEQEHRKWALEPGRLESLGQEAREQGQREDERTRQLEFAIFGQLGGNDPERLAWEARKRGISLEELKEERRPRPAAEAPASAGELRRGQHEPSRNGLQHNGSAGNGTNGHKVEQGETNKNKVEQSETRCGAPGENVSLKAGKMGARTRLRSEASARQARTGEALGTNNQAPAFAGRLRRGKPEKHQVPVARQGTENDPCPMTKSEIQNGEAAGEERHPQQGGSDGAHGVARPTPAEPMFRYRCYCGAKGRMNAAECPHCHLRWSRTMPVCPCHQGVI